MVKKSDEEVYRLLELAFARFPAAAGRRLKSEPALAQLIGLKRTQLRKALDQFVEDGVLIRRHGSGTFLRKVLDAPQLEGTAKIPPFDPFSDMEAEKSRRRMHASDQRLRFAILSDFGSPNLSGTYKKLYEGLSSRSIASGHTVETHPAVHAARGGAARGKIVRSLHSRKYDGLIVRADDMELFDLGNASEMPPVLFIDVGMEQKNVAPVVSFGRDLAMARALRILADAGATRIAMIGWFTPEHNDEYRRKYMESIVSLGLAYSAHQFLGEDPIRNRNIFEALFGSYSEAPDAIYFVDDVALRHAQPHLKELDIRPGHNLRVIAEAESGVSLPPGFDWSIMQFNPFQVGRLAIDCLEAEIQTAGDELVSLTHQAAWREGSTHRLC